MKPLRPELYHNLTRLFHDVLVRHEGEEMRYTINTEGKLQIDESSGGEYYSVNCPYCGDTRKRLWFNYLWGKRLEGQHPNEKNLWLAHCYNESCLRNNYERQLSLYHDVFDYTQPETDVVRRGVKLATDRPFEWPGEVRLLTQLPENHDALYWLTHERKYNIGEITQLYNVHYCIQASPDYRICHHRIIIPVYRDKKPIGFQARLVGRCGENDLKYWSLRGWHRGQCLYNYDLAKQFSTVVVTEGPLDVWRFGPEAVCLFGKDVTPRQLALLNEWKNVVILLDGDVGDKNGLGRTVQHLKRMTHAKWMLAKLPEGVDDPGAMDRHAVRELVYNQMADARMI